MEYRRVEVVGSGMQREGICRGKSQMGKSDRETGKNP